jgi:hypothetical protein
VSAQLHLGDSKTLVHGDFKAMNVFLKQVDDARDVCAIDFQWSGVGNGMCDVAYHLCHSGPLGVMGLVGEETMSNGETALLRVYYDALMSALQREKDVTPSYTWERCVRDYKLSVLDYARVVFSVFFKGGSPASFAARSTNMNVSLVYRDTACMLRFVVQCDAILREIEAED